MVGGTAPLHFCNKPEQYYRYLNQRQVENDRCQSRFEVHA